MNDQINETDSRPFQVVDICGKSLEGLLDSGASISCLGNNGIEFLKELNVKFKKLSSEVKCANGGKQQTVGYVELPITFLGKTRNILLYIIPGLIQKLYLGSNFWKAFNIKITVIEELIAKSNPEMHDLTDIQKNILYKTISKFPSSQVLGLGKTNVLEHHIDVQGAQPIKRRWYHVSPPVEKIIHQEIDRMLDLGVIEVSNSPWCSGMSLVQKGGKNRLCLDARWINEVTKKCAYPIPPVDSLLSRIPNTHWITGIDLKDAYWQVPLTAESKEITAFAVPGRPLYQFTRMPFGLCNASQTFVKLMDRVIPQQYRDSISVYMDDIIVFASDFESMIEKLDLLASLLQNAGLTINIDKSKFCFKKLKYLGYIIGEGKLMTDPEKIAPIVEYPPLKSSKDVSRFLGMVGWYRRFINNYSDLAAPLSDLLKKNKKFVWSAQAQKSFNDLKQALTTAPVLCHPDYEQPFIIQCDASKLGVGSVLYQLGENGQEKVIAYMSKKLNSAQRNYTITELECLAAVLSVKTYRAYIEMLPFKIITDHSSLKWLMNVKDLTGRLARWSFKLQAFNFTIEHRKGRENVVPDALSRAFVDEFQINQSIFQHNSFNSPEYCDLRKTVCENPAVLPGTKVVDGIVYKQTRFNRCSDLNCENIWKVWIPVELRKPLIAEMHDPPLKGHDGFHKTMYRLQKLYYWPKMAIMVKQFIDTCSICQESKHPNYVMRPPMGPGLPVEKPFQRLYVDFVGPYPRTSRGNCYLFVIVDHFSKFTILKPLKNATSRKCIEILEQDVFHLFGVPQFLFSDNGRQFIAKDFKNFLESYGVTHQLSAIHSPQANAAERVNRSLIAKIRAYVDKEQKNWDQNISALASSLRTSVHKTIGTDPHFLIFGQSFISNGNQYEVHQKLDTLNDKDTIFISNDVGREILRDNVKDNIVVAQQQNVNYYNLRSRDISFEPGELVLKRNFHHSNVEKHFNAKLAPLFSKAKILNKVGKVLYDIVDLNDKFLGTYHAKDILKANSPAESQGMVEPHV